MKISEVDIHVLVEDEVDGSATSSAQDDLVVEIHTDEGISGIGESDVNPWIGRACIDAPTTHSMGIGLREILIGADPSDIENLWQRMYIGTAHNGRRGAMINALGAIEMALFDLRGKIEGVPCHQLFGEARPAPIVPYASLQPEVGSYAEYRDSIVDWARRAVGLGFQAVKAEVTFDGPFAHRGLREPWERSTEVIAAVRSAIGPDVALLIDVQYAFENADVAVRTLRDWEEFDLFFVETPLWMDDLEGYARLTREQGIPIAAGEWLTTHHEFDQLVEKGNVSVVQPDLGKVGGFGEAFKVCDLAEANDLLVVPHVWKTGISIAAAAHFAAVTPGCPFIEFLPEELCESGLRKHLANHRLTMSEGRIDLPSRPGLGCEIDREALRHFQAAALAVSA